MKQDLDREIAWHEDNPWDKPGHFLAKWPFVHPKRHERAYAFARANVRNAILAFCNAAGIRDASGRPFERVLVAPCGADADQDVLHDLAAEMHGVDISEGAVRKCPAHVKTRVADILDSGYEDGFFDFVASLLFFHHLHRVGFDPFLREFHRVLRPAGVLAVLEPSALYPVGVLTGLGKKVFGNVTGLVPGEAPIVPSKLTRSMRSAGFKVERFESVSYSHNRMPVPLQRFIDCLTAPARGIPPFSHMGWMCLWICSRDSVTRAECP